MTPHDQAFADKIFRATQADRQKQTDLLLSKLDSLKPKAITFPDIPEVDLSITNDLLSELLEESKKPVTVRLILD